MITTYTLCDRPTLPDTVEVNGVTYALRTVAARYVREGDRVTFMDMTAPSGQTGTWGHAEVTLAESHRSGRGRNYVAPWDRRELHFGKRDWQGTLRSWQVPTGHSFRTGHTDMMTVYRPV